MKSLENKGFSLIELIVAIALLAISGTVIFYGFVASGRIHLNTSQLQMAEDVGQYISEEFKSHSVEWLTNSDPYKNYAVKTTAGIVDTITFTGVPFEYEVESKTGRDDAKFTANITLTSRVNDDGLETEQVTTYKQNRDVAFLYEVNDTVGTNTFIVPEVTNIYDGKSVVVSSEINQFDSRVVSDLWFTIKKDIDTQNALFPASQTGSIIDVGAMSSDFSAKYMPLTNITSPNDLVKSTDIHVVETSNGSNAIYSYVITVKYTFNFDFQLRYMNGLMGPSLSSKVSLGDLASVEGADSTYTVKHTGTKYEVTYSKPLDEALVGRTGMNGSFAGIINVDNDLSTEDLDAKYEYKADGTGDKVADLYILYTPFDLYSDSFSGEANDEITFNFTGSLNSNIVRVFLVTQAVNHVVDPTLTVSVSECEIESGNANFFKVYTNSEEIIDNSFNDIDKLNYLTNSYGKKHVNFYDMKIEIFDKDGNKAAEINTVKED